MRKKFIIPTDREMNNNDNDDDNVKVEEEVEEKINTNPENECTQEQNTYDKFSSQDYSKESII